MQLEALRRFLDLQNHRQVQRLRENETDHRP